MRHAANRHGLLLHPFKQGRLSLRRGPINFIRQQHVGKDRATLKNERSLLLVFPLRQHHGARDIRWHQVRCKLNALKIERQRFRETADHQGLGKAGDTRHQAMPSREQGNQDQVKRVLLPHNHLADLFEQTFACGGEFRH